MGAAPPRARHTLAAVRFYVQQRPSTATRCQLVPPPYVFFPSLAFASGRCCALRKPNTTTVWDRASLTSFCSSSLADLITPIGRQARSGGWTQHDRAGSLSLTSMAGRADPPERAG
jgi:hypothetical protein